MEAWRFEAPSFERSSSRGYRTFQASVQSASQFVDWSNVAVTGAQPNELAANSTFRMRLRAWCNLLAADFGRYAMPHQRDIPAMTSKDLRWCCRGGALPGGLHSPSPRARGERVHPTLGDRSERSESVSSDRGRSRSRICPARCRTSEALCWVVLRGGVGVWSLATRGRPSAGDGAELENQSGWLRTHCERFGLAPESRVLLDTELDTRVVTVSTVARYLRDYGILVGWSMRELRGDPRAEAQLVLTTGGGHHSPGWRDEAQA